MDELTRVAIDSLLNSIAMLNIRVDRVIKGCIADTEGGIALFHKVQTLENRVEVLEQLR